MFRKFNRKAVATAGAIFVIAAGGAYAYWTQGGSGTGSAANGTTVGITVNQTSVITGMYPGGPAQALSGTFTNTNSGPVFVATVTAALTSVTGSTGTPACTIADFQLNNPVVTKNAEIPSGTGVGAWTGPTVQLKNLATNQDACKSASVNLSYTSN
jgi:hypothetical protein